MACFLVNNKSVELYFHCNPQYLNNLKAPLITLGLEDKYDISVTTRGGGTNGQMDAIKLGIARALYREPNILILDEPTSALDENTEKSIINELINLKDVFTIVLITYVL